MRRKSWVQNLLDFWVFLQEFSNDHCIRARLINSHLKRLRSPKAEPGIKWTNNTTSRLHVEVKLVVEVRIVEHESASNNISMTTNILGQGVHDNIGTEFDWILQHWRHEGVVNREDTTFGFANFGYFCNVCAFQGWIRWRLDPHDFCVFLDGVLNFLKIRHVNHVPLNLRLWRETLSQVSLSTSVNIIDAKQVVTLLQHAEHADGCA